jgi:hypothetical protein
MDTEQESQAQPETSFYIRSPIAHCHRKSTLLPVQS